MRALGDILAALLGRCGRCRARGCGTMRVRFADVVGGVAGPVRETVFRCCGKCGHHWRGGL